MKSLKSYRKIIRYLLPLLAIVIYGIYLYLSEGKERIVHVFSNLSLKYAAIAFATYFFSVFFSDCSLYFSRKHYQKHFPLYYVIYNSRSAEFFEILTPGTFAFGPIIHVNNMAKQGLPPSKGIVLVLVRQMASMTTQIIFVIACLSLNFAFFRSKMSIVLWLCFIAALMMLIISILFYLFAPRQDKLIMKIATKVLNFLTRIRMMKEARKEKILKKTEDQIIKLKDNMKYLDYSPFEWIRMMFFTISSNLFSCSINYFSARAMHIDLNGNPMLLIAAISMAGSISSQVAIIPGGLGIQEVCYGAFLLPIFDGNLSNLNFILLFNRIITYYTPLIIGAAFQFVPKPKLTKRTDIVEGFFVAEEEKEEEDSTESKEDGAVEK